MNTSQSISVFTLFVVALIALQGCEGGLEPSPPAEYGTVKGTVYYEGAWPPEEEVRDLRFVAFEQIPVDSTDFFNFTLFSSRLAYGVEQDSFLIMDVENTTFRYNVIAQQYGGITEWRPVGVYNEQGGVFRVEGDTVEISLHVDFDDPPPFPPNR